MPGNDLNSVSDHDEPPDPLLSPTSPTQISLLSKRKSGNPQKVEKSSQDVIDSNENETRSTDTTKNVASEQQRSTMPTLPGGEIIKPKRGRPPNDRTSLSAGPNKAYNPLMKESVPYAVNGGLASGPGVNPEVIAEFASDVSWDSSYCSQVYHSQIDARGDESIGFGHFTGLEIPKRKRGRPPKVRPVDNTITGSPSPKKKRGRPRRVSVPDASYVDIETAVAIDSVVQGINENGSEGTLEHSDNDTDYMQVIHNTENIKRRYTEPASFYQGLPLKPKKKRGRPRKQRPEDAFVNGLLHPVSSGGPPRMETDPMNGYDRSVTVQTVQTSLNHSNPNTASNSHPYPMFPGIPKKKRGRPRKIHDGDNTITTHRTVNMEPGGMRHFAVRDPPKFPHGFVAFGKKKRGRPRKSDSNLDVKEKKKRGRPPKQKTVEDMKFAAPMGYNFMQTPKKRGRPRKIPLPALGPGSFPPQATSPLRTEIINGEKTICLEPSDSEITFTGDNMTPLAQARDTQTGEGPSGFSDLGTNFKAATVPRPSGKRRGRPPKNKNKEPLTIRLVSSGIFITACWVEKLQIRMRYRPKKQQLSCLKLLSFLKVFMAIPKGIYKKLKNLL